MYDRCSIFLFPLVSDYATGVGTWKSLHLLALGFGRSCFQWGSVWALCLSGKDINTTFSVRILNTSDRVGKKFYFHFKKCLLFEDAKNHGQKTTSKTPTLTGNCRPYEGVYLTIGLSLCDSPSKGCSLGDSKIESGCKKTPKKN